MKPIRNNRIAIWSLSAVVLVATAALVYAQGVGWALVNWKVRTAFPNVRRIDPAHLAEWMKDKDRAQPVLLDVRTKPEFEVSHLHGARRVEPDSRADAISISKDQAIVTYCSVGYRSGSFAKALQDAGYTNVQNLSGSIFQWANEGRSMEKDGQRVSKVHPFNGAWGKLLKPELRADIKAVGPGM